MLGVATHPSPWESQLTHRISHLALTEKTDISDSRAMVQYVEHHYTTYSFRFWPVSAHKMVYQKETAVRVYSLNSPILACTQL